MSQEDILILLNAVDAEYLRELNKPRGGKSKTWAFRRLLLHTAFNTGLRGIELTRIKVKDIDLGNGQLLVHSAKKRHAKNDIIWLEDGLIPILTMSIKGKCKDNYLFGDDKQLSTSCLQRAFKECLKLCKNNALTTKTLHSTRHSYGTYYYNKTKDARAVQLQMRLDSIAMVSVYCQPTPEKMRQYASETIYQETPSNTNNQANNVVKHNFGIATA